MADPEIKSYEPYHESRSAAVTESRPAQAVLMAIAYGFPLLQTLLGGAPEAVIHRVTGG